MQNNLLNATEISMLTGCSVYMINHYYRWKRLHPEHELAGLLPDPITKGERQTRYWRPEDVYRIIEFRSKLPRGRGGILGDSTQKYWRKEHLNEEESSNT